MSKRLVKKTLGKLNFEGSIDITDPCYDKDVWCRLNNLEIAEGEHTCVIWYSKTKFKTEDGEEHTSTRVFIIGIYLNGEIPNENDMEIIGSIGVDAGMAGFFHNKKDFTDEEWSELCNRTAKDDAWLWKKEKSFFSRSGYGDGEYMVYAYPATGVPQSLEIRFN